MTTEADPTRNRLPEIAGSSLPDPTDAPVSIEAARPEDQERIRALAGEIDITDTQSIIRFGSKAQEKLTAISDQMLGGVRNKDSGPAGESLREMVSSLRGFDMGELDPNRKPSWWERIFSSSKPLAKFYARYETVQGQIDKITDELEHHEHKLLVDIESLDRLYEESLAFYHQLALHIAAGEEKLRGLDATVIPAKEAEVAAAPEDSQVIRAQELRDLRAARDDLDRRVHDLRLTRQVTMQSLPSIRLVQENDKSLATKIDSTLVNTVPLWKGQLAQAITVHRSREAARAVRDANDLTNDLLTSNAENLRQANTEVRTQVERGVFDVEAISKANAELIATIEDSLRIADEGKVKRAHAEEELKRMEADLRRSLAAAKSSGETPPDGAAR
ncbi:toxic anion resistance protein [Oceanicella sp. SM1341]|uniref:toxic anion resistance protein n=1 Tax=Oceanicella sp. SM1341 TaxID=1548889 RepID=UPI000E54C7B6|nr:toxic anion resistance protein [Oceanicella sp. SM1341]